ncbi:GTP binding protein RARE7L [Cavenderia fasciculata]|uniref:GTP binding protein RARE7L n=1 Tax=Cavenderia fasciculata TaxID=261658 RepID=F4Q290_CACFS|nr:GTP binding protein RARE7L [Cavenderia fasciculata]EGG18110.1 GTP binding protein RARE7L [Cavenderia fasciculata]|eukprot:XP_004366151.1 GTP binding protein RARE7L [Cavenderia fasciculata]
MSTESISFTAYVFGDKDVGKTKLVQKNGDISNTILGDSVSRTVQVNEKSINIQIFERSSRLSLFGMGPNYYKGANAIFAVFDLTYANSYNSVVNTWLREIKKYSSPHSTFIVIGNKNDLPNRLVDDESAIRAKMNEQGIKHYYEVNAIDGSGLDEMFNAIVPDLLEKMDSFNRGSLDTSSNSSSTNMIKEINSKQQLKREKELEKKTRFYFF